jgi:hypothetical protein
LENSLKDHTKRKHKTTSESETQTSANSKISAFQQTDDEIAEYRVICQGGSETPSLFSFPIISRAIPFKCVTCGLVRRHG